MPRRHRAARDRAAPEPPRALGSVAPGWAQSEGYTVRTVAGEKRYVCPGCHQAIHPGTPHLVVIPEDDLESRRHWHSPCWQRELRVRRR